MDGTVQGVEGAEGEAEGVTYVTREDGQVMKNKSLFATLYENILLTLDTVIVICLIKFLVQKQEEKITTNYV